MKQKKRTMVAVLGLWIALSFVFKTNALEADFEIKPSRLDLMIRPNQKITTTFTITNYGDPHTFTPRIMNAAPDPTTGTLSLSKSFRTPLSFTFPNGRRDIGDPVFIKSNQSVNIPVTIETTAGQQKDYYYYFLTEAQTTGPTEGATSINLIPRVGVPLLVTLTNTAEREVKSEISIFRVKPDLSLNLFGREVNLVETGKPVPVYLHVSNTGANVVSPQGMITVRNALTGSIEHPVVRRNVYAHSSRLMLTQSSYDAKCADQDECKRPSLLMEGMLIGTYDLSASMDLGADASKSFKSVSFIAFPFRPVLALLVFCSIYVLYTRRFARHPKKKH